MNKTEIAQTILKKSGAYTAEIDGDFGAESVKAARKYYDFPSDWNVNRLKVGIIQVYATRNSIATGIIDGFWGTNTEAAYEKVLELLGVGTPTKIDVNPNIIVAPKYNHWPKQNYADMVKFYGNVGTNQTSLILPYEMRLAWDLSTKVSKITCHTKVRSSAERIFKATLDHYGLDAIKELHLDLFGGCLNVRKMRGGSSWSIHSWGAAIDIDPDRNKLKWTKKSAFLARPEYEPFWKIVEAEGATSLGKARDYDWMHFQFADL